MKNVANATNYLDIDTKELFRIYSKDKEIQTRRKGKLSKKNSEQ